MPARVPSTSLQQFNSCLIFLYFDLIHGLAINTNLLNNLNGLRSIVLLLFSRILNNPGGFLRSTYSFAKVDYISIRVRTSKCILECCRLHGLNSVCF